MKKYKGISLIETLISLTIVGLSIVALMPVMTVRKDSADTTKGNVFWECNYSNPSPTNGYCTNVPAGITVDTIQLKNTNNALLIGTQEYDASNPKLMVDASGFANMGVFPLYVANKLNYNGQTIDATSGLRIYTGTNNTELASCSGDDILNYPINLYITDNHVIAETNANAGQNSFCTGNGNTIYDGNDIANNLYSIKNNGDEYIHVDNRNNIIGIGKNAVNKLNNTNANTIVIATNPIFQNDLDEDPANANTRLLIGNRNIANDNTENVNISNANQYVINYNRVNNNEFDIFADTTMGNNLTTNSISANSYIVGSDKNLKNIVGKYTKGLSDILKLNPVEYTYKNDTKQKVHAGVIAQDLQKIFPESVFKDNQTGYLSINTDGIFYALLNSIKELNKKNIELKEQNDELEKKIAQLKEIRNRLQNEKGGQHE